MLLNPTALPTTYYSFLSGQQSVPMMPYPGPPLSYSASPAGNNTNYYETLLSETRTQNSEIRMHLCRLMDKIDYLTQQRVSIAVDLLMPIYQTNYCLGKRIVGHVGVEVEFQQAARSIESAK